MTFSTEKPAESPSSAEITEPLSELLEPAWAMRVRESGIRVPLPLQLMLPEAAL